MVVSTVSKSFTKVFGSRNDRMLKQYRRRVERINAEEPRISRLSDAALREKTGEFRRRIAEGERMASMLPEVMAVAREAMDRAVGVRNMLDPQYVDRFHVDSLGEEGQRLYAQTKQRAEALEPEPVPGGEPAPGWMQVDIPLELYDAVREVYSQSKPPFRARPFDVQLIGGMVLGEGRIAEMKTGEGKTIVAPLACYMASLEGMRCHLVTVNDYLVQRDRDWVFPFYYRLGLTVGAIHPMHVQPPEQKAAAYECDVLYGTNSEFGFDYLRDNMKLSREEQVQTRRDFCIVDEVDSILIDEARTPLIISGPAHEDAPRYGQADSIAAHLIQKQKQWDAADEKVKEVEREIKGLEGDIRNTRNKDQVPTMRERMKHLQEQDLPAREAERDQHTQYYEVEPEKKAVHLTHEGVAEAQKQAGVGSFYVGNNMDMPHLLENALRARVIYQRDKEYVVKEGEVVIVDEFTGRLMVGRQWSDGLHQAVEAKEGVEIKQETQTLATVTLQNFFKLYDRLAGMTGTAATEATEFDEIYELDVVGVPTNLPVIRKDRDDLIYLSQKDKWDAILDEIRRMHDLGRPVLVGTTSVETSEMISRMLTRKHSIPHEVLNAKQHEREAHIIENAGALGSVMIATNMAGRGTDIRLHPIPRERLVHHWQQRDLLPKEARAQMSDEQLLDLTWRHVGRQQLGLPQKEVDQRDAESLKLELLRHWVAEDAWWVDGEKAARFPEDQCLAELDKLPDYTRHRLRVYRHVEEMGGLHIVGTERHEARRVDNQLRGRSGRQGDQGSSRFFIALDDELMKMFANKTVLSALSKLGMKEGDAIEHKWVTRSVEKAQRKVEERNYEIRKNLLDYDEVMEHQRNSFYSTRQAVLEGRDTRELVFQYLAAAVEDAVRTYLASDYVPNQVAEWCRQNLDASVEPSKVRLGDANELREAVLRAARADLRHTIEVTLGEYISNDIPVEEWDLRGLTQWAMSQFGVDLKQNQLRRMNVGGIQEQLTQQAIDQLDRKDLSELDKFAVENYEFQELAAWARHKFGIELSPEELARLDPDQAAQQILAQARQAYAQREVTYPVEFIMELVFQGAQQDQQWAADQLVNWVHQRYRLNWTPEGVMGMNGEEIQRRLLEAAEQWLQNGRLEAQAREKVDQYGEDLEGLARWMNERFGVEAEAEPLARAEDRAAYVAEQGREVLRTELAQLERFVLLQILDQAWKDHLYGMDQLKDSIGLRGFAEQDPRIEYKREGANLFAEMQSTVRDRVTDLIFHARLTPNVQLQNVYSGQEATQDQAPLTEPPHGAEQAEHEQGRAPAREAAALAAGAGTVEQQADQRAADHAGSSDGEADEQYVSRQERRAARSRERKSSAGGNKKQRKKRSR